MLKSKSHRLIPIPIHVTAKGHFIMPKGRSVEAVGLRQAARLDYRLQPSRKKTHRDEKLNGILRFHFVGAFAYFTDDNDSQQGWFAVRYVW